MTRKPRENSPGWAVQPSRGTDAALTATRTLSKTFLILLEKTILSLSLGKPKVIPHSAYMLLPAFALTNIYFFKKIITSEKSENFQMDAILYSLHNPKKKYQTSAYMLQHNGKNCQTLPLMPLLLYCRSD